MTPHLGRLTTYVAIALLAGTIAGRAEVAVFGVAAAAVLGWKLLRPDPALTAAVSVSDERLHEGDDVHLVVRLTATGDVDSATVRLWRHPALHVAATDGTTTVSLRDGETREVVVTARATRCAA